MNYKKIFEIIAAVTTHARFAVLPDPDGDTAAAACGVGYYATTEKGKNAGVQIYEIQPPARDGSVSVAFAAHDGPGFDATHEDAWPFVVTFADHATDRDACRVAVDTGTGPGSYRFEIDAYAKPKTVATAIIRHVCDAHDIGRNKGV